MLDAAALASASEDSMEAGSSQLAAAAAAAAAGGSPSSQPQPAPPLGPAAVEAAAAAPAAAPSSLPPPPLRYVGVGEAGWGCAGAAQQYRGCKWTARAGLVLSVPDHARLKAAASAQRQRQREEQGDEDGGGCSGGAAGAAGGASGDANAVPTGPAQLTVYAFHSWGMQLAGQGRAVAGLSKVDWSASGFAAVDGGAAACPGAVARLL